MQRRAIEFHDSELLFVRREGPNLRLRLDAYVHVSHGEPGRDSGTGWTQDVDFILRDARVDVPAPAGRLELADGRLRIGDRVLEGLVPLPFEEVGAVKLELDGIGGKFCATATSLSLLEAGEARFVEDVPGET